MNVAVSVPSPPAPPPEGEGSVVSRCRDFHDKTTVEHDRGAVQTGVWRDQPAGRRTARSAGPERSEGWAEGPQATTPQGRPRRAEQGPLWGCDPRAGCRHPTRGRRHPLRCPIPAHAGPLGQRSGVPSLQGGATSPQGAGQRGVLVPSVARDGPKDHTKPGARLGRQAGV